MLPDADDHPPRLFEAQIDPMVALLVRGQLLPPPVGVVSGLGRMSWTTVPEAPVDEYGHSGFGEDHVRPAPQARNIRPVVDPVPKSSAVQLAPECQLGSGPDAKLPLHPDPCGLIARHR